MNTQHYEINPFLKLLLMDHQKRKPIHFLIVV